MKLFITTKNLDYIRNTQEIELLTKECGGCRPDIIASSAGKYPARMTHVIRKLITCRFSAYDEIFVGFAPQLIIPFFEGKFRRYRNDGGKVTIDFFISVYDTLVNDRKKIKKGSVPASVAAWLDKRTISLADNVVVDTKAHGEYFTENFGLSRDKMQVLYLEADKSVYYPHTVKRAEEDADKRIILYFASMLPLQGVETVLEAAKLMKDDKNIIFKIIGPVKNKVIQDNIRYIDWLPQDRLSDAIADANLCLAGHFNGEIGKACRTIPGKAYIYRAMHKPVILGDNPANRELFDESMDGIGFCRMSDAKSLKAAIEDMLAKQAV